MVGKYRLFISREVCFRGGASDSLVYPAQLGRLGIANVDPRKPTEAHGSPRKLQKPHSAIESEYFQEFHLRDTGWGARPPYMDAPEAQGSSRKPTEAKNIITRPRVRIFHGNFVRELWYAVPDPLHVQTRRRRKPTEAHGS